MKENCWEFKKCGREEGGKNVRELGVCPAATEIRLIGTHGGKYAGRSCWAVAGTYCEGKPQGTYATKLDDCLKCDFYQEVFREEAKDFEFIRKILNKLQKQ